MSFIDSRLKTHFESLSPELREEILKRNVSLYTLTDLIRCLESIINED